VNYVINGDSKDNKGKPEIRDKVKTAGEAITQTNSVYNTEVEEKENDKMRKDRIEA